MKYAEKQLLAVKISKSDCTQVLLFSFIDWHQNLDIFFRDFLLKMGKILGNLKTSPDLSEYLRML